MPVGQLERDRRSPRMPDDHGRAQTQGPDDRGRVRRDVLEAVPGRRLGALTVPALVVGMDREAFRFACFRLAPVQCASWGHADTTGLPTIDYYLSSELLEPDGAQSHYTERLVRLRTLGTVPGTAASAQFYAFASRVRIA